MKKYQKTNTQKIPYLLILLSLIFPMIPQTAVASTTPATIDVWWPTQNTILSGVTPFKTMIPNKNVWDYVMYWQVDGGQLNAMYNSYIDYPHKESIVDLSGWHWNNEGQYLLTFIAKDYAGNIIDQTNVNIYTNVPIAPTPLLVTPISAVTQRVLLVPSPLPSPVLSQSPSSLYVNPASDAKKQADAWRNTQPANAAIMDKLALQPESKWIGDWNTDIQSDVNNYVSAASAINEIPVLVAYNIPERDCGNYSAGGATSPDAYRTWINNVAKGIANRSSIVILEPDALASMTCLSSQDQVIRTSLLKEAVGVLKSAGAKVYIDAGNANWISSPNMAMSLENAGIAQADGFSLNISNFYTTAQSIQYGTNLSKLVGNAHFVIDTSRNGNGSNGQWCNPSGMALGQVPTMQTGNPLVDAFLWIKTPGESDGQCNGGPSAGSWWASYALSLAKAAGW
jgi:endoglucanase